MANIKNPADFPRTVAWSRQTSAGNFGPTHMANRSHTMTLCGRRIPRVGEAWLEEFGDGGCARCEAAVNRYNKIKFGY